MVLPRFDRQLVYFSYSWGDDTPEGRRRELVVDELCSILEEEDKITVGRDKKLVKHGDSIEDFAAEIARGGLILAVISRKSLRSEWCMVHELLQAFRRRNWNDDEFGSDVLALILEDAIDDLDNPLDLAKFWVNQLEKKRKPLEIADPNREHSLKSWSDVDQMKQLLGKLSDLIRALRIRAMPRGYKEICREDFSAIRELVVNRLNEKDSVAYQMSPSRVPGLAQSGVEKLGNSDFHYLALALRRSHQRSGDTPDPLYSWEAYLKTPSDHHYEPLEFPSELGTYLVASTERSDFAPSASGLAAPRTMADLIQKSVDWAQRHRFITLIEIFVPVELLDFDWANLPVTDTRKRFSPPRALVSIRPFVLRSLERFEGEQFSDGLYWLEKKYVQLNKGMGKWIAESDATALDKLGEAEMNEDLVAIKRTDSLEDERSSRLQWLESMVAAMVPVALWRRQGLPVRTRTDLLTHLDRYEGMLNGHNNRDPVPCHCSHFERIPLCRRNMITDPLVQDFVFLLDHPERAPALGLSQDPIVSPD